MFGKMDVKLEAQQERGEVESHCVVLHRIAPSRDEICFVSKLLQIPKNRFSNQRLYLQSTGEKFGWPRPRPVLVVHLFLSVLTIRVIYDARSWYSSNSTTVRGM